MSLDAGYKIKVSITITKMESYNTVTIAKKELEEESLNVNLKTSAKKLNTKITELVSDAKQAVADMLYAIEENNKKEEE
jgi:hypothetical protein